jgi:hypothetical protein
MYQFVNALRDILIFIKQIVLGLLKLYFQSIDNSEFIIKIWMNIENQQLNNYKNSINSFIFVVVQLNL